MQGHDWGGFSGSPAMPDVGEGVRSVRLGCLRGDEMADRGGCVRCAGAGKSCAAASILVAPRNALVARGEALLAAPGTCETAMHGSTDTTGGRGAELLKVTYPNGGAGK